MSLKVTFIFLILFLFSIHCRKDSTDSINDNPEIEWIKTSAPDSIYYTDILILNSGTILVLAYENYIYRSIDHGSTWELINLSASYTFTLELYKENKVLAGTSDGILISEDEGTTWNEFGLDSLMIKDIAYTLYNNLDIIVVGSHKGVFKSCDSGISWDELDCPEGLVISVGVKNDDIIMVGKYEVDHGFFLVTQDGGINWESPLGNCWVQTIFFNSQRNIYLGASPGNWSRGGLYYSENDGTDWIQLLPDSVAVLSGLIINDNEIYVVSSGVVKILDGSHKIKINNGLPCGSLTDISLGIQGHLYVISFYEGIFKSSIPAK